MSNNEYQLPYSGQQVEEMLNNAILGVPQELTEEQKAQARGNIGVEEIDMTEVNEKLDNLLVQVNSGFRAVPGEFTLTEDLGSETTLGTLTLPGVPGGANFYTFEADTDTHTANKAQATGYNLIAGAFQFTNQAQPPENEVERCGYVYYWNSNSQKYGYTPPIASNVNGFTFESYILRAGTYNWTAYYWND